MEKKMMLDLLIHGNIHIPSLLIERYKGLGLTEEECMLLIHVHSFIEKGNPFPTPDELAGRMTCTAAQITVYLRRFVQRGMLKIEQTHHEQLVTDSYSLHPLWEKLIVDQYNDHVTGVSEEEEDALYTLFENEFGRPLSPIECETLMMWVDQDHHSAEIIKAALKEAVISGKLNFRYIDRILFEWKKNGVKTLEDAKAQSEKYRTHQSGSPQTKKSKPNIDFPIYNWLEK